MENLKPCPMCGRVPVVRHKDGYGWEIVCEGHNETSWCPTEEWAIQDWNNYCPECGAKMDGGDENETD